MVLDNEEIRFLGGKIGLGNQVDIDAYLSVSTNENCLTNGLWIDVNHELPYHYNGLQVSSSVKQTKGKQGLLHSRLTNSESTDNVANFWNDGKGSSLNLIANGDGVGLKVVSNATIPTKYSIESYANGGAINTYLRQSKDVDNLYTYKLSTGGGRNAVFENKGTGYNAHFRQNGLSEYNTTNVRMSHTGFGTNLHLSGDINGYQLHVDGRIKLQGLPHGNTEESEEVYYKKFSELSGDDLVMCIG